LLLAYAAGAATSLAVALLLGGKVFAAMKRSIGAGEWLRRGLGAAMLAGVAAIALGLDTGLLARFSTASTGGIEQALVGRLAGKSPRDSAAMRAQNPVSEEGALPVADKAPGTLPVEGNLPPLAARCSGSTRHRSTPRP
jgi:hypothetical protein